MQTFYVTHGTVQILTGLIASEPGLLKRLYDETIETEEVGETILSIERNGIKFSFDLGYTGTSMAISSRIESPSWSMGNTDVHLKGLPQAEKTRLIACEGLSLCEAEIFDNPMFADAIIDIVVENGSGELAIYLGQEWHAWNYVLAEGGKLMPTNSTK